MPPVARPFRRRGKLIAGTVALLAGGAILSGCGAGDTDTVRGRQLFISKCGTCHTLAQAGTSATVGPDLDAAFAQARADGMTDATIEGVVEKQIAHPREVEEGVPDYDRVYMPAELVTGQDAENVAAYVASVAGIPGIKPPTAPGGPGGQVFAQNGCNSCHTLEAAGATGTVGPNLDQELPGQDAKQIEESITDPNKDIVPGFQPDIMPPTYGTQIAPDALRDLVDFLMTCAGDPQNKDCQ
jgi:mono/diheme cytochrome c family protein